MDHSQVHNSVESTYTNRDYNGGSTSQDDDNTNKKMPGRSSSVPATSRSSIEVMTAEWMCSVAQ